MYLAFPIYSVAHLMCVQKNKQTMKLAAVKALADLAKTPVPDIVNLAYNQKNMAFGAEYIQNHLTQGSCQS